MLVLQLLFGHVEALGSLKKLRRYVDPSDQKQCARHDEAGCDEKTAKLHQRRSCPGLTHLYDRLQPVPDHPKTDGAQQHDLGDRLHQFDEPLQTEHAFEAVEWIELFGFWREGIGAKSQRPQQGRRHDGGNHCRGHDAANRQRYLRFNPTGTTAHPWSLIGRMRMERDVIGPRAREVLVEFGVVLENLVISGIRDAIKAGELSPEIPIRDVALQLVAIANSAGPITQDGGSFDRLEQLYLSFTRIVEHAYGQKRKGAKRSSGKGRRKFPAGQNGAKVSPTR